MAHYVIFFVVLSLASIQLGSCFRCYVCDSRQLASCSQDGFKDELYLKDCRNSLVAEFNSAYLNSVYPGLQDMDDGPSTVNKSCYKISHGKSNTVIRTCAYADPRGDENYSTCKAIGEIAKSIPNEESSLQICTACQTDSCNGAGSIMVSLPFVALTAAAAFYYKH